MWWGTNTRERCKISSWRARRGHGATREERRRWFIWHSRQSQHSSLSVLIVEETQTLATVLFFPWDCSLSTACRTSGWKRIWSPTPNIWWTRSCGDLPWKVSAWTPRTSWGSARLTSRTWSLGSHHSGRALMQPSSNVCRSTSEGNLLGLQTRRNLNGESTSGQSCTLLSSVPSGPSWPQYCYKLVRVAGGKEVRTAACQLWRSLDWATQGLILTLHSKKNLRWAQSLLIIGLWNYWFWNENLKIKSIKEFNMTGHCTF